MASSANGNCSAATALATDADADKSCASCGKTGGNLKRCTACKSVWYCGVTCQIDHRKAHRKECKRIKRELEVQQSCNGNEEGRDRAGGRKKAEERFSLWNPRPREDCPICMTVFPLNTELQMYMACCGKLVCCGCTFSQQIVTLKKNQERADGEPLLKNVCPFCRKALPDDSEDEKTIKSMMKRIVLGDAVAASEMSKLFETGEDGHPIDIEKSLELLKLAADLGHGDSNATMGSYYANGEFGFPQDIVKAKMHCKKGAKGGDCNARYNLGVMEGKTGNNSLAIRHLRVAAQSGHPLAINALTLFKEEGFISEDELELAKSAFNEAVKEMRTEQRDRHIQYLKDTGEYDGSILGHYTKTER